MISAVKKYLLGIKNSYLDFQFSNIKDISPFEPKEAVCVFSDPRGGSTWLAGILSSARKSAILWEPLHLEEVPPVKRLNFDWRQYIPENETWEEARTVFEDILSGRILNHWTGYLTSPKEISKAETLIIKFCRGNALLPWLTNQFWFKHKPVYLLRHPFAVVSSQLHQGGWNYSFDGFEIPDTRFSEIYLEHKDFLNGLKHREEALTALWCLTNKAPLSSRGNNIRWKTVKYEDLVMNPMETADGIIEELCLDIDRKQLELNLNRPSITAKKSSPIKGEDQISQWKKLLTPDQVQRMRKVVEYFEIDIYPLEH